MQLLYNLFVFLSSIILRLLALFSPKIKLFVSGRKNVFDVLKESIQPTDSVFWIHCASLGEFEQGRPLIENLKRKHADYKLVLTFFSPSGYEVQKNYEFADVVVYLPLDSVANAIRFLKLVHPSVAIFVKYEFWPNMLNQLKKQKTPTLLVSGIFRKEQVFFQIYGSWMRTKLKTFSHFFVQNQDSLQLLENINFTNSTVSGDTRFDRVFDILKRDNTLDFIERFSVDSYVLVAGSTWKEDEDLLVSYILNKATSDEKIIIAPHNINAEAIQSLKQSLGDKAVLYSEREGVDLSSFQVFIIDTVGLLTKIYSTAHVAYVGGGYTKSGTHNVLEPATFGIPVVIGPNFIKFKEAQDLVALQGCTVTNSQDSVDAVLMGFREDTSSRLKSGKAAQEYIKSSLGASEKISTYIDSVLK
jgi:3-deoxy-D-manno-octulosonic-acid transferase